MRYFSTVRFFAGDPWPMEPFVFRFKMLDIPNTIISAIRALPKQCVAVVLSTEIASPKTIIALERTARQCGKRILWFDCGGTKA